MTREEFLKSEIKKRGYNAKDFAKKIDMPYSTLLSILNKSVGGASLDNVIKICRGLNVSIEILNPFKHSDSDVPQAYKVLNSLGKQKADEYITDLSEQPKYTKNITPVNQYYEPPVEIAAYGADETESSYAAPPEETT